MTTKIKSQSLLLLIVTLVFSCTKIKQEEQITPEIKMTTLNEISTEKFRVYKEFSNALSKIIKQNEVRDFIIVEAMKQLNGDYEILFSNVKGHIFSDNESFEYKIIKNSSNKISSSDIQKFKLLSINIPVNIEKISKTNIPNIVFVYNQNESVHYGFTSSQETFSIKSNIEVVNPYIVVRDNERYNEDGTVKSEILEMVNNRKLTENNPYVDMGKKTRAGRGNGDNEILWSFKVPNLSDIESWANGRPEIRIVATRSANGGGVEKSWFLKDYARSNYSYPSFLAEGTLVCIWTMANQGNPMGYTVNEDDGGGTTSTTVTLPGQNGGPSTSVAVAGKANDQFMLQQTVWNTDPFLTYGGGLFFFYNQNVF